MRKESINLKSHGLYHMELILANNGPAGGGLIYTCMPKLGGNLHNLSPLPNWSAYKLAWLSVGKF